MLRVDEDDAHGQVRQAVAKRRPVLTAVAGFPDAAVGRADKKSERIGGVERYIVDWLLLGPHTNVYQGVLREMPDERARVTAANVAALCGAAGVVDLRSVCVCVCVCVYVYVETRVCFEDVSTKSAGRTLCHSEHVHRIA